MSTDKILERVRLLLDRAEHPNTPGPEAELCFAQANKLMVKHAIDEALIRSQQTASERQAPERREVKLGEGRIAEFWPTLRTILSAAALTNRCRVITFAGGGSKCEIFGFAEDVAWVEMLYTSIYFSFISQINPKWDESKDYDENVYNFKVAGFKWYDINEEAIKHGAPDARALEEVFDWRNGGTKKVPGKKIKGTMITAYKRWAKKIGDNNLVSTTSFDEYRRQFSDAFGTRIAARLQRMQEENEQETKNHEGAALALRDRMDDVDEFLWGTYPHLHPESRKKEMELRRARREEEARERQEMLDAMTPERRHAFLEAEQAKARRQAEKDRKYWERQSRAHQSSAHNRGRSAANNVDLRRPNAGVQNASRKELG